MEFKVNLALFKSTEDSLKARYKEKYDPSKKYPQYSGNMQLTEMDIIKMVTYLQKAKPEATDYNPEGVVTVRAVGYINTSKNGLQYLSINLEPDYKTLKAIEEAEMSGGAATPTSTSTSTGTPIANKVEEDFIPF